MNLRTVLLAFLAGRYPAAYADTAALQRVNRSGLLDRPATIEETRDELRTLANRFKLVVPELDTVSGAVYWTATEDGVKQWHLEGQTHVG
jgi:hypothetical protein